MPYEGDLTALTEAGPVIKSAARDSRGRNGLLERIFNPMRDMLNLLETGEGIRFTAETVTEAALSTSNLVLIRTALGTKTARLDTLALLMGAARPVLTREDLGLAGDGETDDAPRLQERAEHYSALGGATFMLRAQDGEAFYFGGTVRGASNVIIIFISPHKASRYARLTLQGSVAAEANRDNFLLGSDASQGGSSLTLDTSQHGGGVVSSYLAVGDTLYITGLRDSAATPLQEQLLRVTSLNDGTGAVGISPTLDHAYEVEYTAGAYEAAQGAVNRTRVQKVVAVTLASDVAAGATLIPIAVGDIGKLAAGDTVMVYAENTCADIGGSSTAQTHVEMAKIAPSVSGDSAASVRLSRRLERGYTTAKFARLVKIRPIVNASIQGGTVEHTEAPDAEGAAVHPFEMRYAVDSTIIAPSVPNNDVFGTRGAAVQVRRSLRCTVIDPLALDALYVAAGEGYGVSFSQSTDCKLQGGFFSRMRHSVIFQCATNCVATDPLVEHPVHTAIDFHGQNSIGCRVVNPTMSAAADSQSDPGIAPTAIVFGNTTHLAGDHRCGVEGGRVVGFRGDSTTHNPVLLTVTPSTGCQVRDTEFHDIGQFYNHYDVAGAGTLVSSGIRIDSVTIDGCLDWLFLVNSRQNGASLNTLNDIAVYDLTARNWVRGFNATYVTELQVYESEFDDPTSIDASFSYVFQCDTCPDLYISANKLKTNGRGVRLVDCANFRVINNEFADQTAVTTFRDDGGNTGIWLNNSAMGFLPNTTRGGSIITEGPRAAGTVAMADDSFFAFKPERTSGTVTVWNSAGSSLFAQFHFIGIGTADTDLIAGSTTSNVERATGALAGTTGTDAKFTVSAANTGVIYFENRLGSAVTIDFSVS